MVDNDRPRDCMYNTLIGVISPIGAQRAAVSSANVALSLMGPALIDYLANGTNPEPAGNRHPFGAWAPHGIYRCAGENQWVAIAVRGEDMWGRFAALPGLALSSEARLASHHGRIANQGALDAAISAWTSERSVMEVVVVIRTQARIGPMPCTASPVKGRCTP